MAAANQQDIPRIYETDIIPLRSTGQFIVCKHLERIQRIEQAKGLFLKSKFITYAKNDVKYATSFKKEWWRVRVKEKYRPDGTTKRIIEHLDKDGIIDLHPRVKLYTLHPDLGRIPPAMAKIFIFGLVRCADNQNETKFKCQFKNFFGKQAIGIFLRINDNRFIPTYAGDIIFKDFDGIYKSFRDVLLENQLARAAKMDDPHNKILAQRQNAVLARLNAALLLPSAKPRNKKCTYNQAF